jgi:high-affinity Fe2+/Pb2+ permease
MEREMLKGDWTVIQALIFFIVAIAFAYGCWWLSKNGSYWLWYEDMVIETIKATVKPEFLK